MFWGKKNKSRWPIDPSRVEFGSVEYRGVPGVLVAYEGSGTAYPMEVEAFLRRCLDNLSHNRSLRIKSLRLSPRTHRRFRGVLAPFTDWDAVRSRTVNYDEAPRHTGRTITRTVQPFLPRRSKSRHGSAA